MVIQRWQSVLLFVAAVMMGLFTFLQLGQLQLPDYTLSFSTLGFDVEGELTSGTADTFPFYTWAFFCVSIVSTLLPFFNIFKFKNMKFQKTLCLIELLLICAVCVLVYLYGYYTFEGATVNWNYSILCSPIIAFVAIVMAYNRISHDQRILRESERLR